MERGGGGGGGGGGGEGGKQEKKNQTWLYVCPAAYIADFIIL